MATKTSFQLKGKVRDDYLDLVMKFPLTSLKSEEQFQDAQAVLDELLAKGKLTAGEEMYLDALSDLLASYEDAHYPIAPASDADMLRHLMEAKGVAQADLHRDTGLAKSSILGSADRKKALQSPDDPQARRLLQGRCRPSRLEHLNDSGGPPSASSGGAAIGCLQVRLPAKQGEFPQVLIGQKRGPYPTSYRESTP